VTILEKVTLLERIMAKNVEKTYIKFKRSIRAENRILTDDGVSNIGDDISIIDIESDYRI
jgi:hypothetical protein